MFMLRAMEAWEGLAGNKTRETALDNKGPVSWAKESKHQRKAKEINLRC